MKVAKIEKIEQLVIGNSFLRLCLECLLMWRAYYPRTDFEYETEKLLNEGVKFPSEIFYFKKYESYLKNPRANFSLKSTLMQESNDSPDNLFEGFQSEVDVVHKLEKGIKEMGNIQAEFQKSLVSSNGKIFGNDQKIEKNIQKIQEAYQKIFKIMEVAVYSNLEENVYNIFMKYLFEFEEFFEEVLEDYKEVCKKSMTEAFFVAKYRPNIQSR